MQEKLDEKTLENVINSVPYDEGFNKFKSMLENEQRKQKQEIVKKNFDKLTEEGLNKVLYDYHHGDEHEYKRK